MNTARTGTDGVTVPDLALERYLLGELPPAASDRIRRAVETDDRLRSRLAALQAADAAARESCPPPALAADVRRRLDGAAAARAGEPAWRRSAMASVAAVLAAAVAIGVVGLRGGSWTSSTVADSPATGGSEERVKGAEATLVVFRNNDAGGEPLGNDAAAHAGDVLRVGYRVAAPVFGAIVSLDGRGVVTQHLPAEGSRAVPLEAGATVLLDSAYELDDAPRLERFYLISAREVFDLGPITEAIRAAATAAADPALPRLPAGFTSTTLSLRKDARP